MARGREEIERELVRLLGVSEPEAELYIGAISGERIGTRTLKDPTRKGAVSGLSAKGMLIRAGNGSEFTPVHPRLALSNLFRIYDEKAARERKERRLSVDRLTLELVPIYEKTKNTNAPPGEEAHKE